MIVSFRDRATEAVFDGGPDGRGWRFPIAVVRAAHRKLDLLDAAVQLDDLRRPRGNRLKALSGALRGLHSIRVNDQWRLVFRWTPDGPAEVALVDYHR